MLSKIKSKQDLEKKQKRNQAIVGLLLIGLMVFATAGYAILSSDNGDDAGIRVQEQGLEFYRQQDRWLVDIEGQTFGFSYLPSQTKEVVINGSFNLGTYVSQPLYFVDVSGEALTEIISNLGPYILRYQDACVTENSCDADLPLKSCDTDNVLIYSPEDTLEVRKEGTCIYLSGDVLLSSDAFLYKVLGVN